LFLGLAPRKEERGKIVKLGKRQIGFIAGLVVFAIIFFSPASGFFDGLTYEGKTCLALSLMTVVFWATGVAQNGFIAGAYLALLVIMKVAEPADVFYAWTGTTMWLVIGAYLIANAVKTSGLGERIAYNYMYRFVKDYKSVIIGIFVLTVILSLLIPHPWPRAFLILSVMGVVMKSSNMTPADCVKVGFCVFAASVPASLIFITGDAVINPLAASYGGGATFIQWFLYMGVPGVVITILTLILFLVLFKPEQEYSVDKDEIQAKIDGLGAMTTVEKKTLAWIVLAIVLWLTEGVHGINIGWVTLIVGMLMSFPFIGDVLTAKDWGAVPIHVLVFLTAAMAIGKVGGITGMNEWIANTIFPSTAPSNLFILAAFIVLMSIIIHMLLGSVIAVMGVAVPAILAFTSPLGLNAMAPTLICYMAVAAHYMFPFQHLNTLVGAAPDTGNYTQKETLKLGAALIPALFVVCVLVMVPWFQIIGLF